MKPRIPSQKGNYRKLNARLGRYVALVRELYRQLNSEAASLAARTAYAQAGGRDKPFRFADHPETRAAVRRMQRQLADSIEAAILRGTSEEWTQGNLAADLVADRALATYQATLRGERRTVLYQTNSAALQAFQQRADRGMNLSARIWNQAAGHKAALEAAISCAVRKGTSAVTLSKRLSQYLNDFPSLRKDYKQRFGKAADIRDCEYRSARLARSEINMAYRTAEQLRWQQFGFVLGYEIKLSSSHPARDVCDDLAGRYPKDFKWTGWHPNDLCYAVPILQSEEEFWESDDGKGNDAGSANEVKDVPENFKQWVYKNTDRIETAEKRGTLPYFIKDNKERVDGIIDQQASLIDMGKIRERRKGIRTLAKDLTRQTFINKDMPGEITISNTSIKEWLNQPHKYLAEKNEMILDIKNILKIGVYKGWIPDKHNLSIKAHIIETKVSDSLSWIIVREFHDGKMLLHSITDSDTMVNMIKK